MNRIRSERSGPHRYRIAHPSVSSGTLRSLLAMVAFALLWPGVAPAQSGSPQAASVQALDRVIAVVNNEVITRRELDRAVASATSRLTEQRRGAPPSSGMLEREVLEELILQRAQLQHARSAGIQVSEAQIDRAIEGVAQQNRLTMGQLRERLTQENISFADFRDDIRLQIISARLRETEVESRIRISEANVDAFLAEKQGRDQQSAQIEVGQLFLALPEDAAPAQIAAREQEARALLTQLRGPADFATLVARHSEARTDTDRAGSLGWRTLDQLPRLFADAVAGLDVGGLSEVVRSPAGLHILKVLDRRGAAQASDEPIPQTRVRHILIRPGADLGETEILRRLESVRDRVRAGEVAFEAMARQYSVDGSASNGGNLGWVYAGDTVPEFERAMNALQPGEVSDPVRSQFGFHLIQVLERRQDRASDERRRQLARQELVRQRADLAWRQWLDELRARTYVEYRFEQ